MQRPQELLHSFLDGGHIHPGRRRRREFIRASGGRIIFLSLSLSTFVAIHDDPRQPSLTECPKKKNQFQKNVKHWKRNRTNPPPPPPPPHSVKDPYKCQNPSNSQEALDENSRSHKPNQPQRARNRQKSPEITRKSSKILNNRRESLRIPENPGESSRIAKDQTTFGDINEYLGRHRNRK